jgi:hypothetical protein
MSKAAAHRPIKHSSHDTPPCQPKHRKADPVKADMKQSA